MSGADRESPHAAGHVPRWLETLAAWSWRILLVAGMVWVLSWVGIRLSVLLIPMVIAVFVAAVLTPPVDWLRKRGFPDLAAIWTVLLGVAAVIAVVTLALFPVVRDEVAGLDDELGTGIEDVKSWLSDGPLGLDRGQVDRFFDDAGEQVRDRFLSSGGARRVVEALGGVFFGLVVTFFLTKDREVIVGWLVRTVWPDDQDRARAAIDRGWSTLRTYMGGVALVALADAVLIGIGLIVVGVPLAVPLMIVTFVGAFIPLIGGFVAGVLAALVALAAKGVTAALIVTAITVGVQQVEGDVLAPALLGRAMALHPLVILVGVFAGAIVAGIFGAFVTVPLIATYLAVRDELTSEPAAA